MDYRWAAGFIDGEGWIGIRKGSQTSGRPSYQVRMMVAQTKLWPLEELKAMFGGTIQKKKLRSPNKQQWTWVATSATAVDCIEKILPLHVKGPQAGVAMALHSILRPRFKNGHKPLDEGELQAREFLYQEMKTLNQRGDHGNAKAAL